LNHTLHCLVEVERCRESGYLILEENGGVWEVAYILDDILNGEAIMQIMEDHPEVVLNGNNAPSLGYTITISGIDSGDGYLRSEFATAENTTTEAPIDTACPDGLTSLGASSSFGDFDLAIAIDCLAATVTLDIVHNAYNGQWLGLVFSDEMIGTALIYTTGNTAADSEAPRDLGLYQYDNGARSPSEVVWDDSITWTEVSADVTDEVLTIQYTGPLEGSPIDLSDPENLQLRWAMGSDSDAISYHGSGRSDDTLSLNLLTGGIGGGVVTVSGPLVDRFCWEDRNGITLDTNVDLTVDPLDHTIHCLVEVDVCRESGYVIVQEGDDGIWETAYILDESLNEDVIALMVVDYPNLTLGGNAFADGGAYADLDAFGYTVNLTGIDYDDGYLRALDTDVVSVTGPLVDRFCWETREGRALDTNANLYENPLNHTLHCLVEVERCRESGYLILEEVDSEWQVAYILDDILNGMAVTLIMRDHPEVVLNGNNAPSLGYTITISGIDLGDGYLRSEFATFTTTEAVPVDTACPDGFTSLGAMAPFDDFEVGIEVDCVAGTVMVDIQHSAYNGQWLGLVFSDSMIGTALIYTTGNTAADSEAPRDLGLYQYDNGAKSAGNVEWDDSITWTEVSTNEADGVLQIQYTGPLEGSPIDLSNPAELQLRWAMGTSSPAISYHNADRSSTIKTLNLLTGGSSEKTEDLSRQYAHGVIMWLTWGVLASIGIMSSAFRFLYPAGPTWFKIHRGVQVSVVVLHLVGFIIAVVFVDDCGGATDCDDPMHFSNDHMKCGLVVTILCVLQPLNAVLRSHPPAGGWKGGVPPLKRQVWEFVHKRSGYIAWILGCVTAFLGMRLPQIDAQGLADAHMYGWCGMLLAVYLVLSVLKCKNAADDAQTDAMNTKRKSMEPKDTVEMLTAAGTAKVDTAGSPQAEDDKEESLSINS